MGHVPEPLGRLKASCKQKGVSYADISIGSGVDKAAISRFFAGSPKCSARRANRIRKYLRKIGVIGKRDCKQFFNQSGLTRSTIRTMERELAKARTIQNQNGVNHG